MELISGGIMSIDCKLHMIRKKLGEIYDFNGKEIKVKLVLIRFQSKIYPEDEAEILRNNNNKLAYIKYENTRKRIHTIVNRYEEVVVEVIGYYKKFKMATFPDFSLLANDEWVHLKPHTIIAVRKNKTEKVKDDEITNFSYNENNNTMENLNDGEVIYHPFDREKKDNETPPLRKKRKYEKRKVFEKSDKSPNPKEESSTSIYNEFDIKNYLQGILSTNQPSPLTKYSDYANKYPIQKKEHILLPLLPHIQSKEINDEKIEKNDDCEKLTKINLNLKSEDDIKMKNYEQLNLKIYFDINPLNMKSSTIFNFIEVDFFSLWEESFLYEYPIQITILNSHGTILFHDFLDIKKDLKNEASLKAQEIALIQRKTSKAEILVEEQYIAKLSKLFHRGQYLIGYETERLMRILKNYGIDFFDLGVTYLDFSKHCSCIKRMEKGSVRIKSLKIMYESVFKMGIQFNGLDAYENAEALRRLWFYQEKNGGLNSEEEYNKLEI